MLPPGKFRDEAARSRFRKEALALSKLSHPNVQTVHDFDFQDGMDFLVIEYVPGVSLDEKLERDGFTEAEVVSIAIQIAEGLKAAHEKGIVHRDLKPSNLRMTPEGRLKILDFGLAKLIVTPEELGDEGTTLSRFETQTFGGTPHYMSPEQRSGAPVDARSDLYTTGMVLKELLGGKAASSGLQRVIDRCLQREPDERYPSAAALLSELEAVASPKRKSLTVVWAAVAAALLVAAGLLVWSRAAAPVAIDSVVALPSAVAGAEEDAFLADAIPKTVSGFLTQIEGLQTKLPPARIDVERYDGDLERIAQAYRVSALVLSSVTARGEALVLNLELVDAADRRLLWSRTYDGDRGRYLDLTRQAALDLQRYLRPDAAVSIEMPAESSPVELAYQRGLYYSNRYNHRHEMGDFNQSFAAFQEALALDAELADAAAEIAILYEFRMEAGLDPAEGLAQLNTWARRALSTDRENGRAWAVLSLSESGQAQFGPSVLASALRGVKHAPDFPLAHLALMFAFSSCRLGLEASREAARLDPLYLYGPLLAGNREACLGRDPEPDLGLALSVQPDFPLGLLAQANGLTATGRFDEAAALLKRIEPMVEDGRMEPGSFRVVRDMYLVLSSNASSGEALERLRRVASGVDRFPYWSQWMSPPAISILASGGRADVSEDLLLRLHDAGLVMEYDGLVENPANAWIRDNPRLAPVVERAGEHFEEMLAALDEVKARGELPSYLEAPLAEVRAELGSGGR